MKIYTERLHVMVSKKQKKKVVAKAKKIKSEGEVIRNLIDENL